MSDPRSEDDGLRTYLAERDVPCPSCGYNLRGLKDAACPECGVDIRLGVLGPKPLPDGAFVFGIVGLLFLAVFGLAGLSVGATEIGLPALAIAGISLVVWTHRGRWIRTRRIGQRILLALLCWSWPLWIVLLSALLSAAGLLPEYGWT